MSQYFDEDNYAIRTGSLILHNIGQLLPYQLSSSNFHTRDFIYPIGYRATRFYWSMRQTYKRCRYLCCITETDNHPEFSVTVLEDGYDKEVFTALNPNDIWKQILERLDKLRKENDLVKIFPIYFKGEYLFGLTEPHVIRLVESLPGIETLPNYAFKYGRLQLIDMPLTINPSGSARTEPKLRTHFKKSHITSSASTSTSSSSSSNNNGTLSSNGANDEDEDVEDDYGRSEETFSYNKQFTLPKSSQFKKLRLEWRQNVCLSKSEIQVILNIFSFCDLT